MEPGTSQQKDSWFEPSGWMGSFVCLYGFPLGGPRCSNMLVRLTGDSKLALDCGWEGIRLSVSPY